MKKLLLLAVLPTLFFACKKDDPVPAPTGTIRYVNGSITDVYNIFLEGGAYGQLQPGTSKFVTNLAVNSYNVKAVQANNFTQKPISKENTIAVLKNDTTVFIFP